MLLLWLGHSESYTVMLMYMNAINRCILSAGVPCAQLHHTCEICASSTAQPAMLLSSSQPAVSCCSSAHPLVSLRSHS